jgi:hypothetical protein
MPTVDLSTEPEQAALWETLLDLADEMPVPWLLIGAQMVALHALRSARNPPRLSRDGDVLVDVRRMPDGTRALSRHLTGLGFELEQPSWEGVGLEFHRDNVRIDVLAPDRVGERADLRTVPPARTVSVPGGTQAIRRADIVDVRLGDREAAIPVPNLLGALILKLKAIAVDDVPDAQRSDVATLLSLDGDWEAFAQELTNAERALLRRYPEFADANHPAYVDVAHARDAAAVYRQLVGE